jgi:hypothetical protein
MNPSTRHQEAVNRVISYLYGTNTLVIKYSATDLNQLAVACAGDAAFANDPATRYSIEGYLLKLFNGLID